MIQSWRKYIFILFLATTCSAIHSQVIVGTILDGTDRKPIPYAAVYINGSFIATYSDNLGNFTLDITGYSSMLLVVSALGYNSLSITEVPVGKKLTILLKPKIFVLGEIKVTAKGGRAFKRQREKDLKLFRDIFIGETPNSARCKIENEDDIFFQRNPGKDTLMVSADRPVIVKNNSLGYTVTYYLDQFIYSIPDMLLEMNGNILFREDMAKSKSEKKMFEKRRIRAYIGSRTHFFRALYNNDLKGEGFNIKPVPAALTYEEATGIKDSTGSDDLPKIILRTGTIPDRFYVQHVSDIYSSTMILRKDFLIFKKNGYFEGSSVIWEGEMAKQRIGDWLPYEYQPDI